VNVSTDVDDGRMDPTKFAAFGDASTMALLLDCRANIAQTDRLGRTVLMLAARHGQDATVHVLLDHRADITATDFGGRTPLYSAVHGGHASTAKLLLDHRADIRHITKDGRPAVTFAARHGHNSVLKLLLEEGADPNAVNDKGYSALMHAAIGGDTSTVALLVDRGANISAATLAHGFTSLMCAAKHGHTAVLKYLLDCRASINSRSLYGSTALMMAAEYGHRPAVQLLMQRGTNVSIATIRGRTALISAAAGGHAPAMAALLDSNATNSVTTEDIRASDGMGRTALHYVASKGMLHMSRVLVQRASDVAFVRDEFSQTPRDLAIKHSHFDVMSSLPPETTQDAFQRLAGRPAAMVIVASCLVACFLGIWNGSRHGRKQDDSTPSRGVKLLAATAFMSSCMERAITAFRSADVFTAAITLAGFIHTFKPKVWIPIILLLYVAPALALGGRSTTFDLAIGLSTIPASVWTTSAWRPKEAARCAIGVIRLLMLALLPVVMLHFDMSALLNSQDLYQVNAALGNAISGIQVPLPPSIDILRLTAWKQISGDCWMDQEGCFGSTSHYPDCRVGAPRFGATQVISMVASAKDCHASVLVNGFHMHTGVEGLVPRGEFLIEVLRGCEICPAPDEIAILTPTVGELWSMWWQISLGVGFLTLLASARVVLKGAASSLCLGKTGQGERSPEETRNSECEDLMQKIDSLASEDEHSECIRKALQRLEGPSRMVQPESPWSIRLRGAMIFMEFSLHLYCFVLLFTSEHSWCASCLMAAIAYSAATQLCAGHLKDLYAEWLVSIGVGCWQDGLVKASDRYRGAGATLALLATSYGLPLAARSPAQVMLGMLSIILGCVGVGNHLFSKVDVEGSFCGQPSAEENSDVEEETHDNSEDEETATTTNTASAETTERECLA